ncbi:MAG: AAA family ATPase [Ectothiorhodospiraceae bacterium]|nr:AAA family ATPase [Ectothiorhodospiraceae bacterium]
MYLDHFQLKEHPFRLTPDFDFFYMSRGHARAKAYLDYTVVSRDGFAVITGEIGAGKTTLLNKLVNELGEDTIVAHISQTQLDELEFLQAVVSAFGLDIVGAGKVELMNRLRAFLVRQLEADRRVVLAVDEAQNLSYGVLEEVRMLSGIELDKTKLISVILMGQPELERVINSPRLEQLSQRVRLRYHLTPLTETETRDYVLHRLQVAGAPNVELFTPDAYPVIRHYAGGIPRLINTLCDMAMLTAFVEDQHHISAQTVELAARELSWPTFAEREARMKAAGTAPGSAASTMDQRGSSDRQAIEFNQAIEQALESMRQGFDGLRSDLQAIERRLADVARRLDDR